MACLQSRSFFVDPSNNIVLVIFCLFYSDYLKLIENIEAVVLIYLPVVKTTQILVRLSVDY